MRKITKKQVDTIFISEYMPFIRQAEKEYHRGRSTVDRARRREEYNNFIDSLQKDGQITRTQASKYCIPSYLIK